MPAIPVTSDETYPSPSPTTILDDIKDNTRRLTTLERSQLEQRVRALEEYLFGP